MGKKKKKKKFYDWKSGNKNKKVSKLESRRDYLLSGFPEEILELWFHGDEEKTKDFGNFLLYQEELYSEDELDSLSEGKNVYEEKIDKLRMHECRSIHDMIFTLHKMNEVNHKIAKAKRKKSTCDLGIATYLDSSRYSKKYLSASKYQKDIKNIAKREHEELKEMKRLGYIVSKDPDEELKRLKKANSLMEEALSDAYTQKHFL